MTRLIDKDMLIEILGEMQGLCDTKAALIQNSKIWQQVKDLPTVDAVPVVRCKDCKYVGADATCCLVCNREGMGLRPFHVYHDDFCSYAERRTDDLEADKRI